MDTNDNRRDNDMDVYCTRCGEPWDNDSLHDYAEETGATYQQVARAFRTKGCVAFADWGQTLCEKDEKAYNRAILADLLGDDMDGLSATLEDMEYAGLL